MPVEDSDAVHAHCSAQLEALTLSLRPYIHRVLEITRLKIRLGLQCQSFLKATVNTMMTASRRNRCDSCERLRKQVIKHGGGVVASFLVEA